MSTTSNVVIVGAGLAGLMCAYRLVQQQQAVTVVYQGDIHHTSSYYAQGGVACAWNDEDSVLSHISDTIMAGDGLCDSATVQQFCTAAPQFLADLIDIGVPFDKTTQGAYKLTKEGAHTHPRIFHVKDHTGHAIIQTLYEKLKSNPLVTWINAALQGLLQDNDKRVIGVTVNDGQVLGQAVVLATGGFSNVFSQSTNPKKNIGEGIALAYQAGATLSDLEFIQFHPTVYCTSTHPPLLISEALRGEGAFLVNKNNERFMKNYHDLGDLAPRDVVARAIVNEQDVRLNIAALMPTIAIRFPTIFRALIDRGFSDKEYEIPIQPLVHYTLGGISASAAGATNVEGLYAIGECAATGFHGANRLASNSLLEAGVMGDLCAKSLFELLNDSRQLTVAHSIELTPLPASTLVWLGELSRANLGVIRHGDDLMGAIQQLEASDHIYHPMLQFVLAVFQSAFQRRLSRGGHFRSDATSTDDSFTHSHIFIGGEVHHIDTI